ncbi:MAG: HIT domain-containing protein [Verrucomicrobiota bacterium]|nr:HIT domain-containing protein [Verrucomicrobiota bacterium]
MEKINRPLWAPWRIEYIRSEKNLECFICDKKSKDKNDSTNHIVTHGKTAFVILNRYPYNSGHLMIAPYRHTDDICTLSTEEQNEITSLRIKAIEVLRKLMAPEGFNLGYNLGSCAGAGLKDHIHEHIVPRWNGDTNFMPVLGDTRVVPESLDDTCQLIRDTWQSF